MNNTKSNWRVVSAVLIVLCAITTSLLVQAQKRSVEKAISHGHAPPESAGAKATKLPPLSIPDVEVLNQDGQKQRFYTDLVKGKVVVINFVFTTCKAICPQMGANFSKLQSTLGERLGRDVFLISVSTDPETDSPARLKAWGGKFKAKDGWTLVTGEKEDLTALLRVLTGDGPSKSYHSPSIGIVNDQKKTHRWAYGLEGSERLVQMVDELVRAN